jgi:hypothetical protein
MSSVNAISIEEANLSTAWLKTLGAVLGVPASSHFHVVTRIADPTSEDPDIRNAVDQLLDDLDLDSIETVANTIFPAQMAATSDSPESLVDRYRVVLPELRRLHRNNRSGTYFGRLVAYDGPRGRVDQVGGLIAKLRTELRNSGPKSARYEATFDQPADSGNELTSSAPVFIPGQDNAIMGFPCLSLCSFQLDGRNLHLVAHYRSQYLVQRGYGNYLGLARLQQYIARNAGVEPGAMMIVAGRARADGIAKYRFAAMLNSLPQPPG